MIRIHSLHRRLVIFLLLPAMGTFCTGAPHYNVPAIFNREERPNRCRTLFLI